MYINQKKMILNNYRHLEKELQEKLDVYKEARSKFTSIKAQICDDMPKGSPISFDKIGESLARIEELQETYTNAVDERIKIDEAINKLPNVIHRRLIVFRYIKGMQWEAICMKMNYRWTQIHKLHSDALNEINLR